MEYVLQELLTRDEIIGILSARRLHIDNLGTKTLADLHRIYKCFALPRARRGSIRRLSINYVNPVSHVGFNNVCSSSSLKRCTTLEVDDIEEKRLNMFYLNTGEQGLCLELCGKRHLVNMESADTYLSTAAKRIRIDLT